METEQMVQNVTHFIVDSTVSPKLQPCQSCGAQGATFLDTENIGSSPDQPFVYVQCQRCAFVISSCQVFGDLSNASLLDKLSRVSRLWNHIEPYNGERSSWKAGNNSQIRLRLRDAVRLV